jgi:hypothetical protein
MGRPMIIGPAEWTSRVLETLRDWEKGLTRLARFFARHFAAMPSNPLKSGKNDEGYKTLEKSDAKAPILAARSAVEPPPNE